MGDDAFASYGLQPIELEHRPTFDAHFATLAKPLSDYTFSQLYTWRNSLRILWRRIRAHLCVFANGTGDLTLLMPPIGDTGSDAAMAEAFELMDAYNADHGVPERSRLEYVSEELLGRVDATRLDVRPMGADYLYDVNRMIDLAGGDLASKRQAKNRFLRNYKSRVEAYSSVHHRDACAALLGRWKDCQDLNHLNAPDTHALKRQKESLAALLSLQSAEVLGLRGMVVYVKAEGTDLKPGISNLESQIPDPWQLRAFTFGEPLGRDQSSITIEKTDLGTKGLAQYIFSEFCRVEWRDRPLVNVGDDWGLETLAWTKMSYRPVEMLQKFVVRKVPVAAVALTACSSINFPTSTVTEPVAEPVIRPARPDDLAAAEEIERSCFPGSAFSLTKRQLRYLQRRPTAVFLVAEEGKHLVGEGVALVRQHRTGSSGRIYSLGVSPERRGKGIGRRLLERMVAELMSRSVRRIYLEVELGNRAAESLYECYGFRRNTLLRNYYGPGKHAVSMVYETRVSASSYEYAPT